MQLIKCPACQKEVSDQAPACPSCGQPIKPSPVMGSPKSQESPAIAAIISVFFPGVGHMYLGDINNGVLWLVGSIVGYLACFLPGLVVHILCIIDAAKKAQAILDEQPKP